MHLHKICVVQAAGVMTFMCCSNSSCYSRYHFPVSIYEYKLNQFYPKTNDNFFSQRYKDKTFIACLYYWLGNIVNLEKISTNRGL